MDTLLILLWIATAGVPVKVESVDPVEPDGAPPDHVVGWSCSTSPQGGGMPTALLATI